VYLDGWRGSDIAAALECPRKGASVVIDTDTFNEIDDQYAIAYALASGTEMKVEAIYAAPYSHEDICPSPAMGMENSYQEILKVLELAGNKNARLAHRGSREYMGRPRTPVASPAAEDLVSRAMRVAEGEKLFVLAIGAITNVASAIVMEPRIISRIVVVWLAGQSVSSWPTAKDYNLMQDLHSSQVMFESGVPLVLFPACGVTQLLTISAPEIKAYLKGRNTICDYLADITLRYRSPETPEEGWSHIMWDIAAPAWIINDGWFSYRMTESPCLTSDFTWSRSERPHPMIEVYSLTRDAIYRDLLKKLSTLP
jgi:purine nucleosidase